MPTTTTTMPMPAPASHANRHSRGRWPVSATRCSRARTGTLCSSSASTRRPSRLPPTKAPAMWMHGPSGTWMPLCSMPCGSMRRCDASPKRLFGRAARTRLAT
ncbi:hypothetical protein BC831DRAFT_464358 [Entophlyctis helioformis]|nr:hypothetical protein BC831DRAFT_464358 [Entophlyctis helioformis]